MEQSEYKDLLEYFIHEVTQLNYLIKASSELLSKSTQGSMDKKSIIHHSNLIHENSTVLSVLLDVINYNLNPLFFENQEKDLRNLHGKFKKCMISFTRRAKAKNIDLNLESDCNSLINLYPIIDTVPYILLDNAIKYSHKGSSINVDIDDYSSFYRVKVENQGPILTSKEVKKVFVRGFRGAEAEKTGVDGNGFGLNFLQNICNLHNAEIKIESDEESYNMNGIRYSKFTCTIDFPKK